MGQGNIPHIPAFPSTKCIFKYFLLRKRIIRKISTAAVIFLIFFSYLVFLPGILFILIVFFGVSFSYKTLKKKFEWFNRFYHYVILYLLYYGIIIVPLLMVISRVFEVITDKYFNVVG